MAGCDNQVLALSPLYTRLQPHCTGGTRPADATCQAATLNWILIRITEQHCFNPAGFQTVVGVTEGMRNALK